jgi:hypothetical protein
MSHAGGTLAFAVPRRPHALRTRFPVQAGMPGSLGRTVSVRNPTFSLGLCLGVCFSVVGVSWLLVANRAPYFDQFAWERNLALAIAFVVLGLVPTGRFMKSPGKSLLCGITAWAIFTATYSAAEVYFQGLANRLSAFHLFVLGGVILGLLAAFGWVVKLIIALRRVRREHRGIAALEHPLSGRISG